MRSAGPLHIARPGPLRMLAGLAMAGFTCVALGVAASVALGVAASGARAAGDPVSVPLRVVPAEGAAAPAGALLSGGVPFPDGRLAGPEGLRVVDASGAPLPAQLEVRGRFSGSGAVRWLGVELISRAGSDALRLESGPAPPVPDAIEVTRREEVLEVRTGRLRAEIGRRVGSLRRVHLDERLVLDQPGVGWLVRGPDGARLEEVRSGAEARVEKAGPLHAVVRLEGRYRAASGPPGPRWILRLHFHAGRPEIGLQHTFVWDGPADLRVLREIGLGFATPDPQVRARAPRSADGDGEVEVALGSGERLSLLQDGYRSRGRGTPHAALRKLAAGTPRILAESERAGSHVSAWPAAGRGPSVTLVLRDLWQRFPSELRVAPGRIEALLWTDAGRAGPLDLSPQGVLEWIGPALHEQLRGKRFRKQFEGMRGARNLDPTGLARTHDLLLRFGEAGEPDAARLAAVRAFEAPPALVADPHWTADSGALGLVGAVDDARFPEREATLRAVYRDVAGLIDEWGDYGFLDHGAGPHHAYSLDGAAAVARPWRYAGLDFGYTRATWVAWLRSGERRYLDLVRPRTHFLADVLRSHVEAPGRRLGDWFFWGSGPTVVPWATPARPHEAGRPPALGLTTGFGLDVESLLFDWWTRGDLRSLEVAGEVAEALRALAAEPGALEALARNAGANRSRHVFQQMADLAVLGEQLEDATLSGAAHRIAAVVLAPEAPAGVQHEPHREGGPRLGYPSYLFYKAPWIQRYMASQTGRERERAREALLRGAEYALRTRSTELRTAGLRLGLGARLSGDDRYLTLARDLVDRRLAVLLGEPRGSRGYRFPIHGVPGNAADVVTSLAALVATAPGDDVALPVVPLAWKGRKRPEASALLWKPAGRPLEAEIVHGALGLEQPDGRPWPEAWLGAPTAYVPEGTSGEVLHRRVRVPADAPEGLYRLRAPWEGELTVLGSDAAHVVLEAPGGIHLGGGAAGAWSFEFAPGARQVFVSARDGLELRDPSGQRVALPRKRGWMRLRGAAPGLFQLRALRPAFFAASARASLYALADPDAIDAIGDLLHDPVSPRVPDPKGPTARFSAGGLALTGKGTFTLPVPALGADQGAIEWWWRPSWDSGALAAGDRKGLLALDGDGGTVQILFLHAVTSKGAEVWDLRIESVRRGEKRRLTDRLDRGEHLRLRADQPVHMVLDWWRDEEGARYRLWLNGRTVPGPGPKRAAGVWPVPERPRTLRFGPGASRRAHPFDGTLLGLRVSTAPRYPGAQRPRAGSGPPVPERLDPTTAILCRFESEARPCIDASGRATGAVLP